MTYEEEQRSRAIALMHVSKLNSEFKLPNNTISLGSNIQKINRHNRVPENSIKFIQVTSTSMCIFMDAMKFGNETHDCREFFGVRAQ